MLLAACLSAALVLQATTQATLGADYASFSQHKAWYGVGRTRIGTEIDSWSESLIRPGLEGVSILPGSQTLYGRFDAVQANTFGGVDAGITNADLSDVSWLGIDKAYLGWRSGSLFDSLSNDFLDLSLGRQIYTPGTSFLFGSEGGVQALPQKVLAVRTRILGDILPDTSLSVWNLYCTLDQLGETDAARSLLHNPLPWLLNHAPHTLGADQRQIRQYLTQVLSPKNSQEEGR